LADFLAEMEASSLARSKAAGRRFPDHSPPAPAPLPLAAGGFDVIAEIKLGGPATGRLLPPGDDLDLVAGLARAYTSAGACALSVLTEPTRFGGDLAHLAAAAQATALPVIRKDFLIDPGQVLEARAWGASGVLLIARLLVPSQLIEMAAAASELDMICLVEVFDRADLDRAAVVLDRPLLIGVNSRNLADLSVDHRRFAELAPLLPPGIPWVAESGVETSADVAAMAALGYRLALVGTALSRATDPAARLQELIAAGRAGPGLERAG
jgi:indole-3-glycerol phosphate synthase